MHVHSSSLCLGCLDSTRTAAASPLWLAQGNGKLDKPAKKKKKEKKIPFTDAVVSLGEIEAERGEARMQGKRALGGKKVQMLEKTMEEKEKEVEQVEEYNEPCEDDVERDYISLARKQVFEEELLQELAEEETTAISTGRIISGESGWGWR